MEAIILAGGTGTRLKNIVKDKPKPMVKVNGKPFLEIILDYLDKSGFDSVILSVGYLSDVIINHFGNKYKNIKIKYANEKNKLGTGGAIKYALKFCSEKNIFIFNGDTFLDLDFNKILKNIDSKKLFTPIMVSRFVEDVSRYGSLKIESNQLIKYQEKKDLGAGYINAGCYILPKKINLSDGDIDSFSFEKTSIPLIMKNYSFSIYNHKGFFIDIGIPEDLKRAEKMLEIFIK